ncbi:MAG: hypothetical protein EP339_06505 [Gammaproteobacteria bacterium]|nr:MAG: hypothetical protein EP339_06505 [Gammaproteobacteria bacterium]
MSRNVILYGCGLALATGLSFYLALAPEPLEDIEPSRETAAADAPTRNTLSPQQAQITAKKTPLPPELQGLEPNAELPTTPGGDLVPDRNLRRLFDFYLANVDREPLEVVIQRLHAALDQRLDEPAKSQAVALLERYIDYRMAVGELQESLPGGVTLDGLDLGALRQRQAELDALQQTYFESAEQAAFFGRDQQLDDYTLARLEIQQNDALSAEQRQQQLQLLEQQLPVADRQARKRATINADVYQQTNRLKAEGASSTDLYQLRAQSLGEAAALQLAQLDVQQNEWKNRLEGYREEKARILASGLSPEDRNNAITTLRSTRFSGPEQLRVRALETFDQ